MCPRSIAGSGNIVIKHFKHGDELASDLGTSPVGWQRLRPADISLLIIEIKRNCLQENFKCSFSSVFDKFRIGNSSCSEAAVKRCKTQFSNCAFNSTRRKV